MVSTRSSSAAVSTPAPRLKSESSSFSSSSPPPPSQSSAIAPPQPPTTITKTRRANGAATASQKQAPWSHVPSTVTLLWLAVSLPLVVWDTGYVLLRPRTMPGGNLHWPLWVPYKLYGEVDHIYGFKQWNLGNGFTAAQGSLNVIETLMYLVYIGIWYRNAKPAPVTGKRLNGHAAGGSAVTPRATVGRSVLTGRAAALAVLIGFSAAVMTVSKTVLYWLNESFSGFDNIGHNPAMRLIFLWIIPNGAWLVVPSYLIYLFGSEIVDGLTKASGPALRSSVKSD
ncbi:hypothetical protein B0H63DRAFT_78981 [Podospora didyma]|uniref:C6 transcription factor n=1 Tax=Podospora didyma TaxID=330526 RepID=A0AAE0N2T2_9PEZI|nr:hypothetical protein B0H63DRAFT_78981 [Podospora didyma]